MIVSMINRIGVLRVLLYGLAILLMVASFFAGSEVFYEGWRIFPTLIVPSITPIVFFVLLLDLLMASVFMLDGTGDVRTRFQNIIKINLLVVLGIVIFWAPYFSRLATYGS